MNWAHGSPDDAEWNEFMGRLKNDPGPDMTILGSGRIVSQLARSVWLCYEPRA